jgi:hypothetical protein
LSNYFVGDDFTWLRWAFAGSKSELLAYFTQAKGFFYRPLAKIYFFVVSPIFGIKPQGYHLVDIILHLGNGVAAYLLLLRLTRKKFLSSLSAFWLLLHPVNAESVLWVSTTSHLMANFFYLWGFLGYIVWRQTKNYWRPIFYLLAFLAFVLGLFSHERMVTFLLMLFFADWLFGYWQKSNNWRQKLIAYLPFAAMLAIYFWMRNDVAQAHGLSGDYSYRLKNLPFNLVGNSLGYLGELVAGFQFLTVYDLVRGYLRTHKFLAILIGMTGLWLAKKVLGRIRWRPANQERRLILFGLGWFVILLLPFLGLGNIAERYVYGAHLGIFLILAWLVEKVYHCLARIWSAGLAFLAVAILILGLTTFWLTETEKAKQSWRQAGEISNKVLLALATNYESFNDSTHLYFVDLPIRQHRAWVFPVGLDDGLWFIYRDESLVVKQFPLSEIETAFELSEKQPLVHVFLFKDNELVELKAQKHVEQVPIE